MATLVGMNKRRSLTIDLPDWVWDIAEETRPEVEDRMDAVLEMADRNVADGGGPFAAAVFDDQGRMVGPGVNRVVAASAAIAHAEIVAIAVAGQSLGTWDLASAGRFELVSTTEPCAMCLGAVPWSGVRRLVCGARDADARAVGFDEGRKPADWVAHLESIGIDVLQDVRREEAAELLRRYADSGGAIYNGAS